MTIEEFALPDVGEGLREAEIVTWRVTAGDVVEVNQPLVEIETAKSLVELPSPYAGEVAELLAAEGDTVDVGAPIIRISTASPARPDPPTELAEPAFLVGYGPSTTARSRRPRGESRHDHAGSEEEPPGERPQTRVLAKPPVRKLAKDLGIDLTQITPTGPGSTITREDLHNHRNHPHLPGDHAEVVHLSQGIARRIPVRGVRKATAEAMTRSAFTAPHVTEFITVDVSRTMELLAVIGARREFQGVKLSPLVLVARALLIALRRTPEANARWDDGAAGPGGGTADIVQFDDVNLGIAAATPRGLVVPNIKAAQRLPLSDLAGALNDLVADARGGRSTPQALAGGTITITNVGVFGVDTGTPILNPPEAAILALGAINRRPWVVDDGAVDAGGPSRHERIEPRWVTQLALSFDHRVLDGEQGSRLLADVATILHEPGLALP